jgi:hypothetical protein
MRALNGSVRNEERHLPGHLGNADMLYGGKQDNGSTPLAGLVACWLKPGKLEVASLCMM